nr:uncharacterized protein LOC128684734 [Cherax quadricarinatus]
MSSRRSVVSSTKIWMVSVALLSSHTLLALLLWNVLGMTYLEEVRIGARGPLPADHPAVLSLVKNTFLNPPSVLPYNLSTDPIYTKAKNLGTWNFIYENIAKVFQGQRGGFFVEAGALDGERGSNTLWLEQELGWTGLLVEPNPLSYQKLLSKQRKAWISNTCLSPEPFPLESVLVSYSRRDMGQLRALENAITYIGSSHLLGATLESHAFDYVFKESDKSYFSTQCFPLESYLLALNVSTIDFLSLDIQGVEKRILQNVPWNTLN